MKLVNEVKKPKTPDVIREHFSTIGKMGRAIPKSISEEERQRRIKWMEKINETRRMKHGKTQTVQ